MRNREAGFIRGMLLLSFFGALLSCATDRAPLKVTDSLPPSELAYYSDAFDSFREDIWEMAGYVFTHAQMENIKMGDMTIEDGRLRIDTKTGGFSKGGLVSKFTFEGDFDVQIDFQINFAAGEFDMDQSLSFGALELADTMRKNRLLMIGLLKMGSWYFPFPCWGVPLYRYYMLPATATRPYLFFGRVGMRQTKPMPIGIMKSQSSFVRVLSDPMS